MSAPRSATRRPGLPYGDDQLRTLQRNTFRYFWEETNPENGLIPDNTSADDIPASIAGVGLALASYSVAAECSFVPRAKAVERTLATLRFLWNAPQGPMPDATGHRGYFYHFLDVSTGRRAWRSELSTIDTTILIAGALTAAAYFDQDTDDEREVRRLADSLYRRVDWRWAQNGEATVSHGWKPETGFLRDRWQGSTMTFAAHYHSQFAGSSPGAMPSSASGNGAARNRIRVHSPFASWISRPRAAPSAVSSTRTLAGASIRMGSRAWESSWNRISMPTTRRALTAAVTELSGRSTASI